MQKPITIICREFVQQINDVVQNSQLPACIMLSLLHDIEKEISRVAELQLRRDTELYAQMQYEEGVSEKDGKQDNK